jgi:hypothetical protein
MKNQLTQFAVSSRVLLHRLVRLISAFAWQDEIQKIKSANNLWQEVWHELGQANAPFMSNFGEVLTPSERIRALGKYKHPLEPK